MKTHSSRTSLALVLALCAAVAPQAVGCGGTESEDEGPAITGTDPDAPEATSELPRDVRFQFVVGDLNADAKVDALDRELLELAAGSDAAVEGVECLAAGDLTLDDVVDASDLKLFDELTDGGKSPLAASALSWTPALPCELSAPVVAASPSALAEAEGNIIRIRATNELPLRGSVEVVGEGDEVLAEVELVAGAVSAPAIAAGEPMPEPTGDPALAQACVALDECAAACSDDGCVYACGESAPPALAEAFYAAFYCAMESGCGEDAACLAEKCGAEIDALEALCDEAAGDPPAERPESGPSIVVKNAEGGVDVIVQDASVATQVRVKLDETIAGSAIMVYETGDDPRDEPPPTYYGEEIDAEEECPQKGQGCEVLIIDLVAHDPGDWPAQPFVPTFQSAGCNVEYLAPRFDYGRRIRVKKNDGSTRGIEQTEGRRAVLNANNRAAWKTIEDGISRWRANVAGGREYAQVLVNSHGTSAMGACGWWSPAFDTGKMLSRAAFHSANHGVLDRNVCTSVVEDWSCFGGLTPKVIDELNNLGSATCNVGSAVDHEMHAAFEFDAAFSTALSTQECTIGDVHQRMNQLNPALQGEETPTVESLAEEYRDQGFESKFNPLLRTWYGDYGYAECDSDPHAHQH